MMIHRYLFPKEAAISIHTINYDKLWNNGIRGLIFDIDNTLAAFDVPDAPPDVVFLLSSLTKKGFAICFLSNNSKDRVEIFSKKLGYFHIWKAGKPKLKGIKRVMTHLGLEKKQIALIGDQIFTDCFCGNRFGIHTILTKPIARRDEWTVKLKRWPEKLVLHSYFKRGGKYD